MKQRFLNQKLGKRTSHRAEINKAKGDRVTTNKRPDKKKSARRQKTTRRKKPIQRKRPTRFMEPSENTSAQIHQGVAAEAQPEPARRFPEDDAEYGEES
jgi:hypothetical protein